MIVRRDCFFDSRGFTRTRRYPLPRHPLGSGARLYEPVPRSAGSQSSGEYVAKFNRQLHIRSSDHVWRRSDQEITTSARSCDRVFGHDDMIP